MNVLLVCHQFPPDGLGGVERYTESISAELTRQGNRVTVLTRRLTGAAEAGVHRETLPDGTRLHRILGPSAGLDRFLDGHQFLEAQLTRTIRDVSPDIIHINHLRDLSPRYVEVAHQHAPVVLSLHDFHFGCPLIHLQRLDGTLCDGPRGGEECAATCFAYEGAQARLRWTARARYYRQILSIPELVISPSDYVARWFVRFGADARRLRRIPNGITLPRMSPPREYGRKLRTSGLSLAYLGTVAPHKGLHIVLDALRLARLPSVRLWAFGSVGDRGYEANLRRRAQSVPGLSFRIFGSYDPRQLPYLIDGIDCVVVPSVVPESFSITTREALALGIPVVVSRVGALPEAVTDGVNGYTFDPEDLTELARILAALTDEGTIDCLRREAANSPVFTTRQHVAALRAAYAEAIASHPEMRALDWETEDRNSTFLTLLDLGF